MTTLIIAEKPDAARKIASAILGKTNRKDGYLEGNGYLVTWAIGHLLELGDPHLYDEKYKKWDIAHLPIIPDRFILQPNPNTKKQLNVIKEISKKADVIINACDCAREGELIFTYIYQYLKLNQPVKRLWTSSLTNQAIKTAFNNIKDGSDYRNLQLAAKSRSEADWLIGINGSRGFTTQYGEKISVGRVQTPVLAMLYDRQIAIESFTKEPFFDVEATFKQQNTTYKGTWQGPRIHEKTKADSITSKVKGQSGSVQIEGKDSTEAAPKLFNLDTLQQEANKQFGFTAKKILDLAQSLYEKHDAITYPRTSSAYVDETEIQPMHQVFELMKKTKYADIAVDGDKNLVTAQNKNLFNPDEIEDHHAILPTDQIPGSLSPDEEKIYDLIVKRFLAHFYPSAKYRNHTVLTHVNGEAFKTQMKEVKQAGWKVIYSGQKDEEEEQTEVIAAFHLKPDLPVQCIDVRSIAKETTPPKYFTEGTLIRAMKTAGNDLEDHELKEAMKGSGLGTPATRAAIIERLKAVEYIQSQGKKIIVTQKGKTVIELIRRLGIEALTSAELTGQWEKQLNDLAKGQGSDTQFMNQIKSFTSELIDKVKNGQHNVTFQASINAIGPCPAPGCSGSIIEGKKGYGCSNFKTGCKFVIWKEVYHKTLSLKNVQDLISKGKTSILKLKNKVGKQYEAYLVLKDPQTGSLELAFPSQEQKEIGSCPLCKTGQIHDKGTFYGCNRYPECKLSIPKKKADHTIPKGQIQKLIKHGKTDMIQGFMSQAGKSFSARLVIKDNQVIYSFDK